MSFKITKKRKIQVWAEEITGNTQTVLTGGWADKISGLDYHTDLLERRGFPPQLEESIAYYVEKRGISKAKLKKIHDEQIQQLVAMKGAGRDVATKSVFEFLDETKIKIVNETPPLPLILKKYFEFILKSLSTIIDESEDKPINIEERMSGGWKTGATWAGNGWAYKGYIHQFEYKNQPPYSSEEEELLLLEQYDLERQKFEKLKRKHKSGNVETESYKRERISEEVRIAVWRRDDGKCARCGNRENLEYDHIVPVSKGGGNTARNIEMLCESCNRKKSNKIE